MRVLVLEPYYGGSHKAFLSGLAAQLPYRFTLLTLPAHSWKWRMRLAAPYFALQLHEVAAGEGFDCLLCSSLLDVAALKGLLPGRFRELPIQLYFHENQFAYPVRMEDARDAHFGLTNLTSALAADRLAFNSQYNRDSFLEGARELLRKSPDMPLAASVEELRARAAILPPGLDFAELDATALPESGGAPVILWNHRWEHDKNPELFFRTLMELSEEGGAFSLVVLGEAFRSTPPIFAEAKARLQGHILHWGYTQERGEYCRWLRRGTVAVSTARHEFFGLAMLEAVRAGCRPLVPDRLAYRELFPACHRYRDRDFAGRLRLALGQGRLAGQEARELTEPFSWPGLLSAYRQWFEGGR